MEKIENSHLITLTGLFLGISSFTSSFKENSNGEHVKDSEDSPYADQNLVFEHMVTLN